MATSRFFVASWRDTVLFFTAITSFTFRAYDAMLALRPFTVMWPWLTIWRAAARVFAKPRWNTTLSRRVSKICNIVSPVMPRRLSAFS